MYALGGLEEHTTAKRLRRAGDADAWNSGTARPDQIARLKRETANGQRKNDYLAVARCVAAQVNIEDTVVRTGAYAHIFHVCHSCAERYQ